MYACARVSGSACVRASYPRACAFLDAGARVHVPVGGVYAVCGGGWVVVLTSFSFCGGGGVAWRAGCIPLLHRCWVVLGSGWGFWVHASFRSLYRSLYRYAEYLSLSLSASFRLSRASLIY